MSTYWILLPDIHYPEHNRPAIRAVFDFIHQNRARIGGVIYTGDQLNCESISRHTKNKPRLRTRGGYKKDIDGFKSEILLPIDVELRPKAERVFIMGNHEDWLEDILDEMPELEGAIGIAENLGLKKLGYEVIPCGGSYEVGKALVMHGDQIGSGVSIAKKLVETCCQTTIMGHVHTFSAHTKISHVDAKRKWCGFTLPTLGTVAPQYAKGRPNNHVAGFGIVEKQSNGYVNVYVPLIFAGVFSFGGVVYGTCKS